MTLLFRGRLEDRLKEELLDQENNKPKPLWGDAKRIIFEDLIFFGPLLILTIFYDYGFNVLNNFLPFAPDRPVDFGPQQIAITIISIIQLCRRGNEWLYYE